jgi:hypothetical protein
MHRPRLRGGTSFSNSLRSLEKLGGWGGRDRTFECRNQNPVPYRLATPQLLRADDLHRRRAPDHRASPSAFQRADFAYGFERRSRMLRL